MFGPARFLTVLLLCAQAALASIEVLQPEQHKVAAETKIFGAESSTAPPQDVPDTLHHYQQLAVMAQQVNCRHPQINKTFGDATLLFSWGNDDTNQRMHVFHSKSMGITFSWAGMNISSINSVLSAADIFFEDADKSLYPFAEPGTQLYSGFQDAYKRVAPIVEKKAKEYMERFNEDRVSFTGLSFGAALASLASTHMSHALTRGKVYKAVVFGLPRIGNQAWANTVDKALKGTFYYTVNGADPVSRLPPRVLGYQQPSGQLYIKPANSTQWKFYPGQENVHGSDADVGLDLQDHTGIYFSVPVGGVFGPCPAEIPSGLK
ncbi:hypothetical protein CBS14141_000616 [Malassezia furfur]|nr:hypothetical protein CBS14141_000616 [Malassezia furfur]